MIERWAVKGLLHARARVLGSVATAGAALALLMTFRAVWEGETKQLGVYPEHAGADVWVMQSNVSNMHMTTSFLTDGKGNEVADVAGVGSLAGILYLNTMISAGDRSWFSYVVGIEENQELGGPWSVPSGRADVGRGEVIVPETLARVSGTAIGDGIQIADRRLRIVGLSSGTFSAVNPVTFVHVQDLADILSLSGYVSYILVRSERGVPPDELAARIRQEVDGVQALTTAELVASDAQLSRQMGIEVIALMTAICAVLATLLVGFALSIHASHNRRGLATLKALGFSNRHLYASVLLQAVILTGLAFGLAVVVVLIFAAVGPAVVPVLSMSVSTPTLLGIGLAGLAVAAAATMMLARRVARVDPMSVFNS